MKDRQVEPTYAIKKGEPESSPLVLDVTASVDLTPPPVRAAPA